LLKLYAGVAGTGALDTAAGRAAYEFVYRTYKGRFEARAVEALRPYVLPGTAAIDVGANIGFFTERFARWLGPSGVVVAVEPEDANFRSLRRLERRLDHAARILAIQAVAAAENGTLMLRTNPIHPGDHRIAPQGIPVASRTVDSLVVGVEGRRVTFLKIDVQGAELLVIEGAAQTLRQHRPAILIEIDPAGLQAMGHDPGALIETLIGHGYGLQPFGQSARDMDGSSADILALARRAGYLDVLCLPERPH
jgi:FkbM family methyltransferase